MKKVYLAGAIFQTPNAAGWRSAARALFKLANAWEVLDPTTLEATAENEQQVIDTDLRAIAMSNVVLAKVDQPSWGTAMEIYYARSLHIPVVGWLPDWIGTRKSPWLNFHITVFEPTLEAAVWTATKVARND